MEPNTIIGDYVIDSFLTKGGMGEVYLGHHIRLHGQKVAVKRIIRSKMENERTIRRFRREAKIHARLMHPYIVPVRDFLGQDDELFLVLEYVDGMTLRQTLAAIGQIELEAALMIVDYVLQALEYAWNDHHILHRDLKPENIFLTPQGIARVGDFGLAKIFGEESLTKTGEIIGTPQYMPPEQILSPKLTDLRSDLYALGVVMYEMLAGRPPFAKFGGFAVLSAQIGLPPTPIASYRPNLPEKIIAMVDRAMDKSQNRRYQTCREWRDDISAFWGKSSGWSEVWYERSTRTIKDLLYNSHNATTRIVRTVPGWLVVNTAMAGKVEVGDHVREMSSDEEVTLETALGKNIVVFTTHQGAVYRQVVEVNRGEIARVEFLHTRASTITAFPGADSPNLLPESEPHKD